VSDQCIYIFEDPFGHIKIGVAKQSEVGHGCMTEAENPELLRRWRRRYRKTRNDFPSLAVKSKRDRESRFDADFDCSVGGKWRVFVAESINREYHSYGFGIVAPDGTVMNSWIPVLGMAVDAVAGYEEIRQERRLKLKEGHEASSSQAEKI